MLKLLSSRLARLLWVMIPPIILIIVIFFYFTKFFKTEGLNVKSEDNKAEVSLVTFDSLGMRDVLPNSLGSIIKFKLCLDNRNILDIPKGGIMEKSSGAMAIRASAIPSLDLYEEVNSSGCVVVDPEKLISSSVISEVNVRPIVITTVSANSKVDIQVTNTRIDFSKTRLYLRMEWNYFIFLFLSIYVFWFGLVLLLDQVFKFIMAGLSLKDVRG